MLQLGSEVDSYCVKRPIGRGGHAVVWEVEHTVLRSRHALKLLAVDHPGLIRRFESEAKNQARIRHRNVVRVSDVVPIEGRTGIVMDLVDGPTLEAWLEDHEPTLEQALELFNGIIDGLEAAHQAGLVHRDLKPANVLLEPAEKSKVGFVPRITDFGLAKNLNEHSGTRTGVGLGTPEYMAPEQMRNAKGVDARADLFALGCMFYELLTGASPFRRKGQVESMNAVVGGQCIPLREARPDLPEHFAALFADLTAPDPARRPADCAEVRLRLEGVRPVSAPTYDHFPADDETVTAQLPAPRVNTPSPKTVRSQQGLPTGVLLAMLLMAVVAAASIGTLAGLLYVDAADRADVVAPATGAP